MQDAMQDARLLFRLVKQEMTEYLRIGNAAGLEQAISMPFLVRCFLPLVPGQDIVQPSKAYALATQKQTTADRKRDISRRKPTCKQRHTLIQTG